MKKLKLPTWAKVLIALLGTVAASLLVASMVDWRGFEEAIKDLKPLSLMLAFAFLVASMVMQAYKWWVLIPQMPFRPLFRVSMASWFFGLLPGGGVASITSKLLLFRQEHRDFFQASSSLLVDSITKVICMMATICVALLFTSMRPAPVLYWIVGLLLLLFLLLGGAVISRRVRRALLAKAEKLRKYSWGSKACELLERLADTETLEGRDKRGALLHFAAGIGIELLHALPFLVIGREMGIDISLMDWIWINGVTRMAAGLPVSVGGLGVREGTLVLLLALFEVEPVQAMTLSLIYSTLNLLRGFVGAFFIARPGKKKAAGEGR
jgi:uncharacterized protein (TIRG00374 family)